MGNIQEIQAHLTDKNFNGSDLKRVGIYFSELRQKNLDKPLDLIENKNPLKSLIIPNPKNNPKLSNIQSIGSMDKIPDFKEYSEDDSKSSDTDIKKDFSNVQTNLNVSVKPCESGGAKEIETKFKCSKCNETFNCENSLNTHNKIICPPTSLSKDGNNKLYIFQFKCSICVQKFLTREHIIGHLEGFHKKFTKYERYMIKDDEKENIRFDHNLLFENGQYKEMKEKKSFLIENFETKLSENIKEEKYLEKFILDFDQKEKVKKDAIKIYEQFALHTSYFWVKLPHQILPPEYCNFMKYYHN